MTGSTRRLLCSVILATTSPSAFAATKCADKLIVDELNREGYNEHQQKNYNAAIALYDAAFDCDPRPEFLFQKAVILEDARRYPEAANALAAYFYLVQGQKWTDLDHATADKHSKDLMSKVGKVSISASAPTVEIDVSIDDVKLVGTVNAVTNYYVSPGKHHVKVTRRGDGFTDSQTIDVGAGQSKTIYVRFPPQRDPATEPGRITVRAPAPDFEVFIDGKNADPHTPYPTSAGTHVVSARRKTDGELYRTEVFVENSKDQTVDVEFPRMSTSHRGQIGSVVRFDADMYPPQGFAVAVGASFGFGKYVEGVVTYIVGLNRGGEPSVNIYAHSWDVGMGDLRILFSAAVPVIGVSGSSSPHVGTRGGIGLQWDPTRRLGVFIQGGAAYFFGAPTSLRPWSPLLSLGVQSRFL